MFFQKESVPPFIHAMYKFMLSLRLYNNSMQWDFVHLFKNADFIISVKLDQFQR